MWKHHEIGRLHVGCCRFQVGGGRCRFQVGGIDIGLGLDEKAHLTKKYKEISLTALKSAIWSSSWSGLLHSRCGLVSCGLI
jgi:hypothetical protein